MYNLLDGIEFYSAEEVDANFSNESIIKERDRAEAAEQQLQTNIDNLEQQMQTKDTELDGKITTEQQRAEAAETALDGRMTNYEQNLNAESTRAQEAEARIQSNLDASVRNLTAKDTELGDKIAAEQARAEAAEQQLQDNITAEQQRATAAEQVNAAAIAAEALRAQETERDINNALLSESTRAEEKEGELDTTITNEVQRAQQAEQTLQNNIDAEVQRATAAEETNKSAIEAEVTRATAAEEANTQAIEAEVQRATEKETALEEKIDNEVTRATAAEQQNTQAIEAEVQRATNKENELNQLIADEELRATTAEATITSNVTSLSTRVTQLNVEVDTNRTQQILTFATEADLPATNYVAATRSKIKNGQLALVVDIQEWRQASTTATENDLVTWSKYNMPMSADKLEDYPYVVNPKPGQWRWLRFDPDNKNGLVIQKGVVINLSYFGTNATLRINQDMKFDMGSSLVNGANYYVIMTYDGTDIQLTPKLRVNVQDDDIVIGRFHTLCVSVGSNVTMIARAPKGAVVITPNSSTYTIKPYTKEDPDFYSFYTKTITAVDDTRTNYRVITCAHPLSDFVAGNILPESVFCTTFIPSTRLQTIKLPLSEDAMVYDKGTGKAVDVYLQSDSGNYTASVYGNIATTGKTQLLHAADYVDVAKELLSDEEFTSAALGSNECTSVVGGTLTTVGGHVDTAGRRMISAIGCEEMCGMLMQYVRDIGPVGWLNVSDYGGAVTNWTNKCDPDAAFGQTFGVPYVMFAGGCFNDGVHCGSLARASDFTRANLDINHTLCGRGTCRIIRGYE